MPDPIALTDDSAQFKARIEQAHLPPDLKDKADQMVRRFEQALKLIEEQNVIHLRVEDFNKKRILTLDCATAPELVVKLNEFRGARARDPPDRPAVDAGQDRGRDPGTKRVADDAGPIWLGSGGYLCGWPLAACNG